MAFLTCNITANAGSDDPIAIRMTLTALDDNVRLGYGLRYNPYGNAIDEADLPLCAFLPQPFIG